MKQDTITIENNIHLPVKDTAIIDYNQTGITPIREIDDTAAQQVDIQVKDSVVQEKKSIKKNITDTPQKETVISLPSTKFDSQQKKEIIIRKPTLVKKEPDEISNYFITGFIVDTVPKLLKSNVFKENNPETNARLVTLKKEELLGKKIHFQSNNWIILWGICIALIILGVRMFYGKYVDNVIKSLFNIHLSEKLMREKNILSRRVAFFLDLNYVLVVGFFMYQLFLFFGLTVSWHAVWQYVLITLIVGAILLCRIGINWLTGFIFNYTGYFSEYIHNWLLVNKNLGMLLFPIILAYIFIPDSLKPIIFYLSIGIYLFSHLLRLFKGIQIIISKDFFYFYTFLYLCTLEIAPLFIGYRVYKLLI